MKRIAMGTCCFGAALLGGFAAVLTTTATETESATISPFDKEFDAANMFLPPGLESETVTLPEAVVCGTEYAAKEVAESFETYGTSLRFSVAYETYSKHGLRCRHATMYPLATGSIPFEARTLAKLYTHSKAFVVRNGGEYVVVARPHVLEAVFRTCRFRFTPISADTQIKDTDSCWLNL